MKLKRREDPRQLEIRRPPHPQPQPPLLLAPTHICNIAVRPVVAIVAAPLLVALSVGAALVLSVLVQVEVEVDFPHQRLRPEKLKRRVRLLKGGEDNLDLHDAFAATWWQSTERFLGQDFRSMDAVEDGCFSMFERSFEDVRMTRDWLDFSVEHLSKWWGVMGALETDNPAISDRIVRKLEEYVRRSWTEIVVGGSEVGTEVTKSTIVVLPFLAYQSTDHPPRGDTLTIASLAATLASLLRVGMGRVVVFGHLSDDVHMVQRAFALLRNGAADSNERASQTALPTSQIGPMEVGYIRAKDPPLTFDNDLNIPKAALLSLRRSLKGNSNKEERDLWFGGTNGDSRWKYVYLTEPDTILKARPSALLAFGESIGQGRIAVPHRLQPIPHEFDATGAGVDPSRYLPSSGAFGEVVVLDTKGDDSCCDGGGHKPGILLGKCGTFWWICGFDTEEEGDDPFQRHKRLVPYQLMRLVGGTGFVSLAGTEHGRQCIPRARGECNPPVRNQTDRVHPRDVGFS